MITIESIKRIAGEQFEVTFVENGTRKTSPFEYSVSPASNGLRPIPSIVSADAGFHEFIGANRDFKRQLFRKVKDMMN